MIKVFWKRTESLDLVNKIRNINKQVNVINFEEAL